MTHRPAPPLVVSCASLYGTRLVRYLRLPRGAKAPVSAMQNRSTPNPGPSRVDLGQLVLSAGEADPAFIKMAFGSGEMHAAGAFPFKGAAGEWQIWRLRITTARPVSAMSQGWAITAAYCLAGHLDYEGQDPLRAVLGTL